MGYVPEGVTGRSGQLSSRSQLRMHSFHPGCQAPRPVRRPRQTTAPASVTSLPWPLPLRTRGGGMAATSSSGGDAGGGSDAYENLFRSKVFSSELVVKEFDRCAALVLRLRVLHSPSEKDP